MEEYKILSGRECNILRETSLFLFNLFPICIIII